VRGQQQYWQGREHEEARADSAWVLPEAKSAVSFALPLHLDEIRATLAKKSHYAFAKNTFEVNADATKLSYKLAHRLLQEG
jgi:epoxyqueuosine reductase QueG